jgi:hypothetical protein
MAMSMDHCASTVAMAQPVAPRRGHAQVAQREQPVAGDVDREAHARREHDRPRPAEAFGGVAMRQEGQHRRQPEAHHLHIADGMRDGARIGAEPGQHGPDRQQARQQR